MNHDMQDRPGNARPTPERARKGAYRIGETKDAGIRYAIDEHSDPLQRAYAQKLIEPWEWDAAEAFEELARRNMGDVGQRSCINFEPVGHDDTDGDVEAAAKWKVIRMKLQDCGGFPVWQQVQAVCYFRDEITDYRLLRHGLEVCAEYFGISR